MIRGFTQAEYETLLRQDFATFVGRCFADLNPQADLALNWHLEVIAAKLMEVRHRNIRRLIINMSHDIDFIEVIFHPTRYRRLTACSRRQLGGRSKDGVRQAPRCAQRADLRPPSEPNDDPAAFEGYPGLAQAIFGWAAETGGHALRLVLSGLFDRFPSLTIILGHMGEALPFYLWRIDSRFKISEPKVSLRQMPSAQPAPPASLVRTSLSQC